MASYQIAPPEKFDFSQPEQWPKWSRRFERFRQASGLTAKDEESQVNTLVYAMGDQADDILCSMRLSDEDKKVYDTVKTKFEAHFIKRRNPIFERAKFNQRRQEEGESADSFITSLYCLAEHCAYGALHNEMISDRIVVGLRDANLSVKLQMDPELTLDKAVTLARQSEAIKQQQAVVRGGAGSNPPGVNAITRQPYKRQQWGDRLKKQLPPRSTPPQQATCTRCGRSPPHTRQQCPAREAVCHKCAKKGHFQSVCRSNKQVATVQAADDGSFLGTVTAQVQTSTGKVGTDPWMVDLLLNGSPVQFKIDTGADVTVLPESTFQQLSGITLQQASRSLRGPSQHPLQVCGQFTAILSQGVREVEEEIYVVQGLETALVGRPAIEAMGLISKVNTVKGCEEYVNTYPDLYQGLGSMEGAYHIKLRPDAKPFALSTPRRVALPLLPKVKQELERMEKMGVITKVNGPTDWCAGMVVVPKPAGGVRICVDLTKLNKSVRRERHILPAVNHILAQISGAKVFTKLDANAGFWQVKLSKESARLTTFITPFGRFCFNRLPFGITSAPEHFQKRMSDILAGLEGVVCMIDDILIHGSTQEEHDQRLAAVLERLRKAKVTLNLAKCEFSKSRVKFLGQILDGSGVQPDPEKVEAILAMKPLTSIAEVRRFLGMINQLSKFTPHLAAKAKPLRDLLSKKNQWTWGESQRQAFDEVKQQLSSSPVLALYDPGKETCVSADASSYGLGAVLTQKQPDSSWRPVAYASRALTNTEVRYAQIEKESLAATWACERFSDYLIGKEFCLETDHKPLVTLLGSKNLDELPARVQRFRMRLMRFTYSITYVPGKNLTVADTLSRAPVSISHADEDELRAEVETFVHAVMQNLPATEQRLEEIRQAQEEDEICQQLKSYCEKGWPERYRVEGTIKPYLPVASELTFQDGLLVRGNRIVIPTSLRLDILERLHSRHQGISKCRERARQSVWWPGLGRQLEEVVRNCTKCCKDRSQAPEPLIPSPFPTLPWQQIATDLFDWKGSKYLLIVDYYSRYIETARLSSESSAEVIRHTKSIFARHGIPQVVVSDNGPQFSSIEFRRFAAQGIHKAMVRRKEQ